MKKYFFFINYSIIIFIKIFVLSIFGAQIMPDSNGYILESKTLFDTMPFRNYGYPLIISIMSFFFHNWEINLVLIQIIISGITSFYTFNTLIKMKLTKNLSFFVISIVNLSILFFLDLCILPDSFISNCFTIIICNFLRIFITKSNLFFLVFINSILFTLCFILKSQFLYFLPTFLLIFISLYKIYNLRKILLSIFIFIIPVFISQESIKFIHGKKFNQNSVNFSNNTIYLYSLIKPYKDFDMKNLNLDNDQFNSILKKNINGEEFSIVYNIIRDLKEQDFDDKEVAAIIKKKYFETIIYNPEFLLIKIFYNLKPTSIWGIFQPFLNVSQIYSVKNQDNDYWRFRLIVKKFFIDLRINDGFLAILIFLEMIVSSYIFLYVLFNSVKKYFFNKNYFFINSEKNEDFIILLVLFYYVFIFLHLIVHIEPRYLAPVNVIPILAYVFFKRSAKDK